MAYSTVFLKATIHQATLLPVTVASNNVASCMIVIFCHVACCQQHVAAIRPLFYSRQHVVGNSCWQQCCLVYVGLKTNKKNLSSLLYQVTRYRYCAVSTCYWSNGVPCYVYISAPPHSNSLDSFDFAKRHSIP